MSVKNMSMNRPYYECQKKRYAERWIKKMICPNIDSLQFKFRFFVEKFFIADLTR